MRTVTRDQRFDTRVSVRGSEDIAQIVVGFNQMLKELNERELAKLSAEAKLQNMAMVDELTGFPNRRMLFDRLSQTLARAKRQQQTVGLLYLDLDGFKAVNDSLGHKFGDILLSQVAQGLRFRSRASDTLAIRALFRCLPYHEQDRLAFGLRRTEKVPGSIEAPGRGDNQRQQWFFESSKAEDRADQVESHADQIGEQPKSRDQLVPYQIVIVAPIVGDDAQQTTESVQDEGAKVGGQRNCEQ